MEMPMAVVNQPGVPTTGYPPQQFGGYPPVFAPSGYPPQQVGYPPVVGPSGYPPQQAGGYPPAVGPTGYPPQQVGFPPVVATPGYPPQQFGHPPAVNGPNLGALEYLATLGQVFVKQKVELLEAVTGFETNNEYNILDPQGRRIFHAKEDTDCCTRNCCGKKRPFDMRLRDGNHQEVMHLVRPFACQSCWFPCCLQSIQVQAPVGNFIGKVEQKWSLCRPSFDVKDASGQSIYYIEGECCNFSCLGLDVEFKIYNGTNKSLEIGMISKKWSGLAQEIFTDADNFGISFPRDANQEMKAVLIGACMLIDFMYFEDSGNTKNEIK